MTDNLESLERRVAAYDPHTATRADWRQHIELVRELFRRRLRILQLVREEPHREN